MTELAACQVRQEREESEWDVKEGGGETSSLSSPCRDRIHTSGGRPTDIEASRYLAEAPRSALLVI